MAHPLCEPKGLCFQLNDLRNGTRLKLQKQKPPISRVIDELEIAKQFANRRPDYVKGLIQYCRLFARGRDQEPLDYFTVGVLEAWFANRHEAPTTQASNIGRLSSLFGYGVRREYLKKNPCGQLEKFSIDRPDPVIFTPEQVQDALDYFAKNHERFMLWLVLACIVGIRPAELKKMNEPALRKHLRDKIIIINSKISKVRHRRIIELTDHAMEWIKFSQRLNSQLPLPKSYLRKCRARLKTLLGLDKWPQDVLRHTALSYLLVFHGDEARVAMESGNSVAVLRTHYKGLVTPAESRRFQKTLPDFNIESQTCTQLRLIF